LIYFLTDMLLLKDIMSTMEVIFSPTRLKERMESDEPRRIKFAMELLDPHRAKDRRDTDEPMLVKPITVIALPLLAIDRTLKLEVKVEALITESLQTEPLDASPIIDTLLPTRTKRRTLIEEAICIESYTEACQVVVLAKLRKENEDPNVTLSIMDICP
jgi:hypothetical protein